MKMDDTKIKAPEGKVLKAYLIDINPFSRGLVRHVLVDQWGMVFVPGYGWCSLQDSYRIMTLPTPVERGNERDNSSWKWEEWWQQNWKCDSWAWCYSRKMPEFHPCYIQTEPGGMQVIYGC